MYISFKLVNNFCYLCDYLFIYFIRDNLLQILYMCNEADSESWSKRNKQLLILITFIQCTLLAMNTNSCIMSSGSDLSTLQSLRFYSDGMGEYCLESSQTFPFECPTNF